MLTLHTKLASAETIDGVLALPYHLREKCRLRATLVSGEEVAVFMVRGSVLRDGELLTGEMQASEVLSGEVLSDEVISGAVLNGEVPGGPGPDRASREKWRVIQVVAIAEPVYVVRCASALQLARCAFHLGNRHTQVQIGEGQLRLRVDPVLRDMLEGLGAAVEESLAPFEPEAGAYGGAGHSHGDHLLAPVPLRQKIHRPSDRPAVA